MVCIIVMQEDDRITRCRLLVIIDTAMSPRIMAPIKERIGKATERLALRTTFPAFRAPAPGHWTHGTHERNLRILWRILQEEQQQPNAERDTD